MRFPKTLQNVSKTVHKCAKCVQNRPKSVQNCRGQSSLTASAFLSRLFCLSWLSFAFLRCKNHHFSREKSPFSIDEWLHFLLMNLHLNHLNHLNHTSAPASTSRPRFCFNTQTVHFQYKLLISQHVYGRSFETTHPRLLVLLRAINLSKQ